MEAVGIPKWAAPNVHLHEPIPWINGPDAESKLGEDRYDNALCISPDTGKIYVVDNGYVPQRNYVALTLKVFLISLLFCQEMVEGAIAIVGEDAFTSNKIPVDLVHKFESQVKEIDEKAVSIANAFWAAECKRLIGKN